MFHATDNLYFERVADGAVRIIKTEGGRPPGSPEALGAPEGRIVFEQTVDDGTWGSIVLTMSAFGERGGDWQTFMQHHNGRVDILAGVDAKA